MLYCGRCNNHLLLADVIAKCVVVDVIAKCVMADVFAKYVMADVVVICGRWNSHFLCDGLMLLPHGRWNNNMVGM